jgi:hypothetical protein
MNMEGLDMAKKILHKIRIDECSAVDVAANPHCVVKLIKRDAGEPVELTYEQRLQAAADQYRTEAVAKAAKPVSEYQEYRKRLFEGPRTEPKPTPLAPTNRAHERLMSMAKRAAAADPTRRTAEQHYMLLAESNPKLLQKAVRVTLDWDDPDQDDETDADSLDADADDCDYPELDPTPANDPGRGMPAPTAAEARTNRGRSDAPYNDQGDNLRQTPKPAVWGRTEGSYSPSRRGSTIRGNPPGVTSRTGTLDKRLAVDGAAERVRLQKIERRVAKYLAANPTASRVEAHRYAEMGKKQRKAFNPALAC